MPNRIIKESICTSDNIDQLTPFQENVFIRLMVNCDDFGRFDGRPKILSSRLFPLKNITPEEMEEALQALVDADLITVYEVDGKPYLHMNTWEKHQQQRATKSKYPPPDASNCNQLISNDSKCPRNRIRESVNDNRIRESGTGVPDDEARRIQSDHDAVIDAAENAGFKISNDVIETLIALYAENGLQKVLDALKSCVEHGAPNLAYLKAVLKGEPKKTKPTVSAQAYSQRDYSGEQEDAMMRMIRGAG